ncbi:AvrD family protein [Ralstonia pseudosolanacearum]|uniref:AvrD family protein n=1 Tax=Ralstonia pseudosolanacearum TaxID=1310165 RepID=UPI002006A024|nr:AvrD family protein [Ralstonia pseudosolanacearum]
MAILFKPSLAKTCEASIPARRIDMALSYYDSIDDLLGRRETRYFGNGYINTTRSVFDFECIETDTGLQFSCVAALELPSLWSAKGDSKQKPHLSGVVA